MCEAQHSCKRLHKSRRSEKAAIFTRSVLLLHYVQLNTTKTLSWYDGKAPYLPRGEIQPQ